MPENRIDPTAAPSCSGAPAPSPTGTPLLPAKVVPYAYAVWLFLGGAITALPEGRPQLIGGLVVVALGVLLGMSSPGLRR